MQILVMKTNSGAFLHKYAPILQNSPNKGRVKFKIELIKCQIWLQEIAGVLDL